MPIPGIPQPQYITVDNEIRLRRFDGCFDFAFDWYQDEETVYLVDGVRKKYGWDDLQRMYNYLNGHGELYFIEIKENQTYRPIGDVTFWQDDLPIVIGDKNCRAKGIGRKVIEVLVQRGRELGYPALKVNEIYGFNPASRKCFESVGFKAYARTERGNRFELKSG